MSSQGWFTTLNIALINMTVTMPAWSPGTILILARVTNSGVVDKS
jgi:hypothetical protein